MWIRLGSRFRGRGGVVRGHGYKRSEAKSNPGESNSERSSDWFMWPERGHYFVYKSGIFVSVPSGAVLFIKIAFCPDGNCISIPGARHSTGDWFTAPEIQFSIRSCHQNNGIGYLKHHLVMWYEKLMESEPSSPGKRSDNTPADLNTNWSVGIQTLNVWPIWTVGGNGIGPWSSSSRLLVSNPSSQFRCADDLKQKTFAINLGLHAAIPLIVYYASEQLCKPQ